MGIAYRLPPLPPGRANMMVADTAQAFPVGQPEAISAVTSYTLVQNNLSANRALPANEPRAWEIATPLTDTLPVWHALIYHRPQEIALDTADCQAVMDLLRSEDVFAALRVPAPTVAVTEALRLPLVFDPAFMPTLILNDYNPYQQVLSATLTYRPERQTFAANALPAAPGEHWVTFGLDDAPLTCPSGLDLSVNGWGFETHLNLDLSSQPEQCADCTLSYYFCYEGQEEPLATLAADLAGNLASVTNYQGEGITCIGPSILQLSDWQDAWLLDGTPYAYVTPTVTTTVRLRYKIVNDLPGSALQVENMAYTSTLNAGWQWYVGNWLEPNLSQPLTFPLTVPADHPIAYAWLMGQIPPGTADGAYTVWVTATANADPLVWEATSQILVGDWVAPPPQLPPATPQLLSPADGASVGRHVTLAWQAGAGEVPLGFEIEIDGAATSTYNTAQTQTFSAGVHTWRVRAFNDGGYSPWSPRRTFTATNLNYLYLPLTIK